MNLAFTPITRRAIPTSYRSPGLTVYSPPSSGSSSSMSVSFLETVRLAGPVLSIVDLGASLRLSWSPVVDAFVYTLFRSTSPAGPFASYVVGISSTDYVDTPSLPGTYYYKVSAIEPNAGETELSNRVNGTV